MSLSWAAYLVFKLVGRAVAQGGVEAVQIEVGVEVVRPFQPGFFEAGEGRDVGNSSVFGHNGGRVGHGSGRVGHGGAGPGRAGAQRL